MTHSSMKLDDLSLEGVAPGEESARPLRAVSRTSVLHLIHPADVGGAETVVRLLASAQASSGGRVCVGAVVEAESRASEFVSALRQADVEVQYLRIGARDYRRERKAIANLCRQFSPDVVHSHGYRADVVDSLHVRGQLPIVATVHGFTGGDLRNRFYQWVQCQAYRRFDAVVAVSNPLRHELSRRIGSRALHLLPNAYAQERGALTRSAARAQLGIPDDRFLIGWVGRLSPEKGADVLLDALVYEEVPRDARAVFLGAGVGEKALLARSASLGLGERVLWKGSVPNAGALLSAFDVLVLSSRTEGTPMVLLEAMAAGTPIIASIVGGVPDLLPPGSALLVPPESPAALALAIRNVYTNRPAASRRAEAARRRLVTTYGVAAWVTQYEHIYHRARERAAERFS